MQSKCCLAPVIPSSEGVSPNSYSCMICGGPCETIEGDPANPVEITEPEITEPEKPLSQEDDVAQDETWQA